MNQAHEDNRRSWNAWFSTAVSRRFADREDRWRRSVHEPEVAFEPAALRMIRTFARELPGMRACQIASGDNLAAFALAGMGAEVTSVDQSEVQLEIASGRARELGLEIRFVRSDVADMGEVGDGSLDLVCYTNGMMVWLADLAPVYREIHRILRPGGRLIGFDIHPFTRPWRNVPMRLEMEKDYW
jgi:SAM-dependent methyltransferase